MQTLEGFKDQEKTRKKRGKGKKEKKRKKGKEKLEESIKKWSKSKI